MVAQEIDLSLERIATCLITAFTRPHLNGLRYGLSATREPKKVFNEQRRAVGRSKDPLSDLWRENQRIQLELRDPGIQELMTLGIVAEPANGRGCGTIAGESPT